MTYDPLLVSFSYTSILKIDRFFISYQFEEDMFQTQSLSKPFTRRQALMRQDVK